MRIKSFLFNYTISNTLIFTLLLIFLFFSLIPILGIAKYNVPSADDFSFSCETHKAVMENQSFFGLCAACLYLMARHIFCCLHDVITTFNLGFSVLFLNHPYNAYFSHRRHLFLVFSAFFRAFSNKQIFIRHYCICHQYHIHTICSYG